MKITKEKISYKTRLIKAIIPNLLFWVAVTIFYGWFFYEDLNPTYLYILLFFLLISLIKSIWYALKSARFQMFFVELSEGQFEIKYLDRDEEKEIKSNGKETFDIELLGQERGIFPLNTKKRVVFLRVENKTNGLELIQHVSGIWKSEELHKLYYEGFHYLYYHYWIKNFEAKLEP